MKKAIKTDALFAFRSSGGKARALALSRKRRREIAKKAAEARWNKPPKHL